MSQDQKTENPSQGGIAPVDMLVSVGGRMVVVRAGQYLPSAATPSGEIADLVRNDEPFEQEDITETDPLPEPTPAPEPKPEPAPEAAQAKPKTKGAKK